MIFAIELDRGRPKIKMNAECTTSNYFKYKIRRTLQNEIDTTVRRNNTI